MTAQSTIPAERVLDLLAELDRSKQLDTALLEQRRAYRQAAAVLAGIEDLSSLKPVEPASSKTPADRLLGDDLVPIKMKRLSGKVMLSADVRRQALSELISSDTLSAALEANPKERTGPVQVQFECYLTGNAKPIEQQTLSELEDTLQALVWLDGVPISHPSLDDVRRRLDYLRLLAPFESLAGDDVFRGRQSELDSLRSYVGVLPPASLLARLKGTALSWLQPPQQPALSVFGPGGVGKSALVARFMLEHTRLPEAVRIPFAYLDFERPTLDIGKPLTLCVEMIRQLQLQFPLSGGVDSLLEFANSRKVADANQVRAAHNVLADLLGIIEGRLGPRPYVVTLDTFEEVQYRGEASAFPLWDMLIELQKQRPFLRVVVSGRAPASSLRLADRPPNSLEIGSLDSSSAIAFLGAQGVEDPQLAARIVGQVGGVPLSLKLAASLVKRDGVDEKGVRNLAGRSSFWFSASNEMIQGQLFERILGHIHNPQVERLAHPGLAMRRITPEVILNVLNVPCSLAIETIEEAQSLFDELRNETALVMVHQDEDAEELVHRPDLRRIMLKLLVQKCPAQVREIHMRAVNWYAKRPGLRARAEELYHRLQLGESVDKSALGDRSVRFSIQASIEELPVASQLLLASYGLEVSAAILERASHEQKDATVAARIEELLPYGPTSVAEASRLAMPLLNQQNGSGIIYRAAARVALQQGETDEGLRLVEQGLSVTIPGNDTLETLNLLRDKAWAQRRSQEESSILGQLQEYALRHQMAAAIVQERAQSYEMTFGLPSSQPRGRDAEAAVFEISGLLAGLSSVEIWGLVPALGLVMQPLLTVIPTVLGSFCPKLAEDGGPFQLASFSDGSTQEALKMLVSAAMTASLNANMVVEFAQSFERLCSVWPYRVLSVQPPYGSRGSRGLAEAL
ncbi:hypothetical protein CT676_27760 [Bradyrhizobium sp. MOS001]|nr:hypothetical protein CT676_27760 [Bradyrhizobium sp. MOS001]